MFLAARVPCTVINPSERSAINSGYIELRIAQERIQDDSSSAAALPSVPERFIYIRPATDFLDGSLKPFAEFGARSSMLSWGMRFISAVLHQIR